MKIIITNPFPEGTSLPKGLEPELIDAKLPSEEFAERVGDAAGLLLMGPGHKLDASFFRKVAPTLKVVATASVGFDHIDLAAAKQRGIAVTNTPDVLTDCTADLGFLLLLGAARRAREGLHVMEKGWGQPIGFHEMLGTSLAGKTLGIFGMGRIGRALAHRARAFGMKILYCNRHRLKESEEEGGQYFSSLEEMLPHCQFLSLFAPNTPETQGLMNSRRFGLLPKGAIFVNAARGSLVVEADLIEALQSGQVRAAGLDVFQDEPNFNRALADFPQVFLLPHQGSATRETRAAMAERALGNVAAVLEGREPRDRLV